MKPFATLTRQGQLRRIRRLAEAALEAYGLGGARLTFVQYSANFVYRVDVPGAGDGPAHRGPYRPQRYVLRVLYTQRWESVRGELAWLAAMSREGGLPVPQPVPTLEGELLARIATPGIPEGRIVSLLRWIDGRRLRTGLRPRHFRAWGQMMARLHRFSAAWQPPAGFQRPHWDWAGQLGGAEFRTPVDELVASMPRHLQAPFQLVSRGARAVMDKLGTGPDAYGLIHADMYPENVLFRAGQAYPIDFEDCGFGYWIWDLAIALCLWPSMGDGRWRRDAFLDGYTRVRPLPEAQLQHLDLFVAAQYATMVLWATAFIRNDPARRPEHEAWRDEYAAKLLQIVECG
jgi:Ser/Thr protein kinase RdoA (MazF antagonist)